MDKVWALDVERMLHLVRLEQWLCVLGNHALIQRLLSLIRQVLIVLEDAKSSLWVERRRLVELLLSRIHLRSGCHWSLVSWNSLAARTGEVVGVSRVSLQPWLSNTMQCFTWPPVELTLVFLFDLKQFLNIHR